MPLLNEPFSFAYFGHNITARSLGPATIPDISAITSVHLVPFTSEGNIVSVNIVNRGWDIPGGHVDRGESSPLDTLQREAREEASLSTLEPILVDVLALECETLDLKARPYMLIYVAEVAELSSFAPNDEVSQRLLMTPKMFVDSYFGNKAYAQALINASASALIPGYTCTTLASEGSLYTSQISQKPVASKTKSIKKKLIIVAVVIVILLFNFPLLHMLNTKRKLDNVSLPLSSKVVSMGSNGLAADRTNVSFVVNKSYPNTLEAKNDIIKKFQMAGISIPQPDEGAYISPQGNGTSGGDFINEIHISYFPNNSHIEFTFALERTLSCGFESTGGKYAEYQCEGKTVNKAFDDKLVSSQPISSVRVNTSVNF